MSFANLLSCFRSAANTSRERPYLPARNPRTIDPLPLIPTPQSRSETQSSARVTPVSEQMPKNTNTFQPGRCLPPQNRRDNIHPSQNDVDRKINGIDLDGLEMLKKLAAKYGRCIIASGTGKTMNLVARVASRIYFNHHHQDTLETSSDWRQLLENLKKYPDYEEAFQEVDERIKSVLCDIYELD